MISRMITHQGVILGVHRLNQGGRGYIITVNRLKQARHAQVNRQAINAGTIKPLITRFLAAAEVLTAVRGAVAAPISRRGHTRLPSDARLDVVLMLMMLVLRM